MSKEIEKFFVGLESILVDITPIGNELDKDSVLLKTVFEKLVAIGGLRLLIPVEQGGLGGDRLTWIRHNIEMAQYSGALLLLQAQHQFSITQLIRFLPQSEKLLIKLARKNIGIGIFLAANRQALQIKKEAESFRLSGQLPWVTGLGFFPNVLISFCYNNIDYYSLLPFKEIKQSNGSISISSKIKTVVFESTNTVALTLNNWLISENDVLFFEMRSLKKPQEHPAIYNLAGAAKALLKIVPQGKYFQSQEAKNYHHKLEKKWQDYYDEIIRGDLCPLELRAKWLMLAEQCAVFARIAFGATGTLESLPLARISGEIWQYTIAGYTNEQVVAYLKNKYLFTFL